jgi:hypothetical protein
MMLPPGIRQRGLGERHEHGVRDRRRVLELAEVGVGADRVLTHLVLELEHVAHALVEVVDVLEGEREVVGGSLVRHRRRLRGLLDGRRARLAHQRRDGLVARHLLKLEHRGGGRPASGRVELVVEPPAAGPCLAHAPNISDVASGAQAALCRN